MHRLLTFAVCLLSLLLGRVGLAADDTAHIVLLHVNDIHGHTQGELVNGKPAGGYPRLASAVDEIRKQVGADHVLLIHAGDEFSRGDELTTQTLGAANITLMNQIGVNLWTPGNGEFYAGAPNLQTRMAEAKFPTLAANISYRFGGQHFAKDTTVLTVQGVRLGFIGLCFIHTAHPSSFILKMDDPIQTAKRLAPELRKTADVVICVDHLGLPLDRKLAADVSGVDLIIGGHSHDVLPKGSQVTNPAGKPVLIAQAGEYLHYLGRIDLDLKKSPDGWQIVSSKARLIPLGAGIPEDPAVKATIARLSATLTTQPSTTQTAQPQPAGVD